MICAIAKIKPLGNLLRAYGIRIKCHSRVTVPCLHGLQEADEGVLGSFGAVLGYCQALFHRAVGPREQTEKVLAGLQGLPWSHSHELFYGYKDTKMEANVFLERALAPLQEDGRVPILITNLVPGNDDEKISEIFGSKRHHSASETMLVRMMVASENIPAAKLLLDKLVEETARLREHPPFWPLFQPIGELRGLADQFGDNWEYSCWAINPFTSEAVLRELSQQVVVAQFPVGHTDGVSEDLITLAPGMKISGAEDADRYSMESYLQRMTPLDSWPTMIVLGPTQEGWSDEENRSRVEKIVKLLTSKVVNHWDFVSAQRREQVMNLTH